MLYTIKEFVKNETNQIITRKNKEGEIIATVCFLGDNVLNHNGNYSRFALTIWLKPSDIELGKTQLEGQLIRQIPFTKADGSVVLRNVVVANGVEFDRQNNEFYSADDSETIPEYTVDATGSKKPNWLIKQYVNLKEYYPHLQLVTC